MDCLLKENKTNDDKIALPEEVLEMLGLPTRKNKSLLAQYRKLFLPAIRLQRIDSLQSYHTKNYNEGTLNEITNCEEKSSIMLANKDITCSESWSEICEQDGDQKVVSDKDEDDFLTFADEESLRNPVSETLETDTTKEDTTPNSVNSGGTMCVTHAETLNDLDDKDEEDFTLYLQPSPVPSPVPSEDNTIKTPNIIDSKTKTPSIEPDDPSEVKAEPDLTKLLTNTAQSVKNEKDSLTEPMLCRKRIHCEDQKPDKKVKQKRRRVAKKEDTKSSNIKGFRPDDDLRTLFVKAPELQLQQQLHHYQTSSWMSKTVNCKKSETINQPLHNALYDKERRLHRTLPDQNPCNFTITKAKYPTQAHSQGSSLKIISKKPIPAHSKLPINFNMYSRLYCIIDHGYNPKGNEFIPQHQNGVQSIYF